MTIKKNVIFLVPVYNCADLMDEWLSHVKELDPKPERIVFCENNSTDGTLEKVHSIKIKGVKTEIIRFWTRDPKDKKAFPFKDHCYDIVAHARQLLLTRARVLDPDYAIFIDSDIFLYDPTTIDSLTLWQKDIIGGAYPRVFPEGIYIATLFYTSALGESAKYWKKMKKLDPRILTYEVHATSGGCLCLSRKVIQDRRVNFFPVRKGYSEDFGYCKTARENGYGVFLDGTLLLGHKITVRWRSWDIVRAKDDKRAKDFDDGSMIKRIKKEVAKRKATQKQA